MGPEERQRARERERARPVAVRRRLIMGGLRKQKAKSEKRKAKSEKKREGSVGDFGWGERWD